jgi:hypothetical protein
MLFEGKSEVPASWYSGTLVIPRGEVVNYVHMGYASTHERYTVLQVTRGRIDSRRELSAAEYEVLRKERFAKFKLTPEYARLMEELSPGSSVIEAEEFLYEYAVEEYISVAQ